jgi:CDP-glucose 4,6-dehydratase
MLQIAAGTHLKPDIQATAHHEISHQYLSSAKARQVLGWSPGHTVEEALILTVRWYERFLKGQLQPAEQAS